MIYTASKVKHAAKWLALRGEGVPIISTWIDEAGAGETSDWGDLWVRCVREASTAKAVLVYAEDGERLKGALVEVGAALAFGVPVYVVLNGCGDAAELAAQLGSWVRHPLVRRAEGGVQRARRNAERRGAEVTEQDKLLRAIWGDPADNTVRMAYADFLDENGLSPGHAALIRGQIGGRIKDVTAFESSTYQQGWAWKSDTIISETDPPVPTTIFGDLLGPLPRWWRSWAGEHVVFRRGFPDELRIPSTWLVRTCPGCNGMGTPEPGNVRGHWERCRDNYPCTGRVSGPAVEMFRFPITRVSYTDKEPADTRRKGGGGPNSRRYTWWQEGRGNLADFDRRDRHWLPPELFPMSGERRRANYPHKEDALKAASDKAVEYGRAAKIPAEYPPFSFAGALPPE